MPTSPITFVKQSYDELKKVTWPTRSEITRLTVSVIIISAIVGIFIGAVDYVLTKGLTFLLNR